MKIRFVLILCPLFLFLSCSLQKMTIRAMKPIISNSFQSLFEESDLVLAKSAIEADLKLLEALLKSDPENRELLLFAAQGFSSYALGFVEDVNPARARALYLRARDYGMRLLRQKKWFSTALQGDLAGFSNSLKQLKKKDVPALFWTANAWGSWINLSMTDPDALVDLPKVQAMMERIIELDAGYFYGGAHLFLGTILIVKPVIMGGNPAESKLHFKKCLTFCDNKFLLPLVYYARYYAVQTLDEDLFDTLIKTVLETSIDILPEQRLPNAIAQQKARRLLNLREELF